jgi:putative endonuclease
MISANPIRLRLLSWEHRLHTAIRARAHAAGSPIKPQHLITGERGEDAAFFHLRSLGYTLVARRWRSNRRPGDLDLIAWHNDTLIIIEVKTRTAHDLAPAETQVDPHKQFVLRRMAAAYLRQFPERHRTRIPLRFDILSVYLLPTGEEFEHFPAAFPMRDEPRFRR